MKQVTLKTLSITTATAALLALTSAAAHAEGNILDITQDEGNYIAIVNQSGNNNNAAILQRNTSVNGFTDLNGVVTLDQSGEFNSANIEQRNSSLQIDVTQAGSANLLDVNPITTIPTGSDSITIVQNGSNNEAFLDADSGSNVTQDGFNNAIFASGNFDIEQVGSNNVITSNRVANIVQHGDNLTAVYSANGRFSGAAQIHQLAGSDGSSVRVSHTLNSRGSVTQTGADNVAIVDAGAFSQYEINQSASNSRAQINQTISVADAVIVQADGEFNDGIIEQGSGGSASLIQVGSFNSASITQGSFAGVVTNVANVQQYGDSNNATVNQATTGNVLNAVQNGGATLIVNQ